MTQKELLYLEDAYSHEVSIISICKKAQEETNDNIIKDYMNNQISIHQALKNDLMNLLKDVANE